MSSAASPPRVVEDCRGVLRVFSDGAIVRSNLPPAFPFPLRDDTAIPVDWKDVPFSSDHSELDLRLYRPRHLPPGTKLPVFFFFHGGGFCIGNRTWPNFHNCCLRLASELPALVVAPDYRLAPEHRLPAAYHDAAAALLWLRSDADPWIADSADLDRVFVSGESAGGNITHHLAVLFGSSEKRADLTPARVRGSILIMPAFGGSHRTRSEVDCAEQAMLSMELCERYWRLALPLGATADHPIANPFGLDSPSLEEAELGPMLVVVAEKDVLRDRGLEYARRMQEWGKPAEAVEVKGEEHAFFGLNPWSEPVTRLLEVFRQFIDKCCG